MPHDRLPVVLYDLPLLYRTRVALGAEAAFACASYRLLSDRAVWGVNGFPHLCSPSRATCSYDGRQWASANPSDVLERRVGFRLGSFLPRARALGFSMLRGMTTLPPSRSARDALHVAFSRSFRMKCHCCYERGAVLTGQLRVLCGFGSAKSLHRGHRVMIGRSAQHSIVPSQRSLSPSNCFKQPVLKMAAGAWRFPIGSLALFLRTARISVTACQLLEAR